MKKILIIDDEEKIVEILEGYFLKEGYSVLKAYTGEGGFEAFKTFEVDIILLDLMLPGIKGEKLATKMKAIKDVPIIMLTAKVSENDILNGFDLGVDDYITKPFRPKEVVARVRAVLNRTKKEETLTFGNIKISRENHLVYINNNEVILTPSEFKILWVLAENKNKVFTRGELLDSCLNDCFEVYDRIIDTHIKNIRNKFRDCGERQGVIRTIHGVGYRFMGGEDEIVK